MPFDVILVIAGVVLYLLFQALGNKKRTQQRPTPSGGTTQPSEPPSMDMGLEDALREIREALGGGRPPRERAPEPPTPPARPEPRLKPRPEPARSTRQPKYQGQEEYMPVAEDHREAHFLPDLRKADQRRSPAELSRAALPTLSTAAPRRQPSTLLARLRDRRSARDAILLSEILGPPRAHKRRG